MSNWTHVAGIIRIDHLGRCLGEKKYDFSKLIGKEIETDEDFEDAEKNPEKYLPFGSETSLKMVVWENPYKSSLAGYTVSIFGDLRDHDSADEIVEWFKEICAIFVVRQAAITVQNEQFGIKNFFL